MESSDGQRALVPIWFVCLSFVVALLSGASILGLTHLEHSSSPWYKLGILKFPIFSIGLVALFAIPVGLGLCIRRRTRCAGVRVAIFASATFLATFCALRYSLVMRSETFRDLAVRSRPLVAAIETYVAEHGEPPETLEALTPTYLASVPTTGMANYPAYRYYAGDTARERFGNPWCLEIFTPSGVLNFDTFVYYPNKDYRDSCMGRVERIEDWAYLHE